MTSTFLPPFSNLPSFPYISTAIKPDYRFSFLREKWTRSRERICAVLLNLATISNAIDASENGGCGIGSLPENFLMAQIPSELGREAYNSHTRGGGMDAWRIILEFVKE
jgi:hypothetical protein